MSVQTVTVQTGGKDNIAQGGNECKFYRVYSVGRQYVIQYGSMRNGVSGGQFKVVVGDSGAAEAQFRRKQNEGYQASSTVHFDLDTGKFYDVLAKQGDKAAGQWIENMFDAAYASNAVYNLGVNAPPTTQTGSVGLANDKVTTADHQHAVQDRLSTLVSSALAAITLATADPMKALVEQAKISTALEAVELDLRKVKSYLSTLDTLIEEVL